MKKFLFFLLIAIISSSKPNRAPAKNKSQFDIWLEERDSSLQEAHKWLNENDYFDSVKNILSNGGYEEEAVQSAQSYCDTDFGKEEFCKAFISEYNEFLKSQ